MPPPRTCTIGGQQHTTNQCHYHHQVWLGHRDLCPIQWGEPCDCTTTTPPLTDQNAATEEGESE